MRIMCIDIEGAYGVMRPSEDGFYTSCVGFVSNDGVEEIVWLDHNIHERTPNAVERIQKLIDSADLVVGHNLKYDLTALTHYGVDFKHVKIWDTMVAEYLLSGQDVNVRKFGLDAVAEWHEVGQKHGDKVRLYWDNGVQTADIPVEILAEYQIRDCYVPLWIYAKQMIVAEGVGMLKLIELQCEFTLSLIEMEYNGVKMDLDKANEIQTTYKAKADEVQEKIREKLKEPHLDLGSLIQRSAAIFGGMLKLRYKKWVMRTLKSKPESTYRESTIRTEHPIKGLGFAPPRNPKSRNKNGYYKVKHDIIEMLTTHNEEDKRAKKWLLDYATFTKIHQTLKGKSYNTGLLRKVGNDGKIHPNLKQTASKTGRLTSSNPNGQNLFTAVKRALIPSFDYIGQCDLSQAEWRIAGELSDDVVIIDEVNSGVDQHVETCRGMMELPFISKADPESYENRTHAKVFNFRMIFGGSVWGFHLDINMPNFGVAKWKKIIAAFWKKYFRLGNWHNDNIKKVFRYGRLTSPTGRWWKFYKVLEEEGEKVYSRNQIKNYPVQGMAGGDILPLACVIIRRGMIAMGLKSKMILTVHDSIVFDIVKGEEDQIKNLSIKTCNALREYVKAYFGIPWRIYLEGEFEIGTNYAELKEVKLDQTCQEVLNG